eukprot:NODE_189_length_13483_cov_0.581067.p8 type:complete len:142 gc:universal NODE_189_length_13483_cov_0.581067:3390-2965(-)
MPPLKCTILGAFLNICIPNGNVMFTNLANDSSILTFVRSIAVEIIHLVILYNSSFMVGMWTDLPAKNRFKYLAFINNRDSPLGFTAKNPGTMWDAPLTSFNIPSFIIFLIFFFTFFISLIGIPYGFTILFGTSLINSFVKM